MSYNDGQASTGVNYPMNPWRIQLFGTFALTAPDGLRLTLTSRKLETLVAVLVVSHPYGLSRDEICRIVWPETESKQSLRQALYALRKSLGTGAIDATMDRCRLSETFCFESDYSQPDLRSSTIFMPNGEGNWFDHIRQKLNEPNLPISEGLISDSFVRTLDWFSRNDAEGFFKLVNSSPNLMRGIPFLTLKELSQRALLSSGEFRGWAFYWLGTAEENLLEVENLLHQALQFAQQNRDAALASEVTLELGKALVRLGKTEKAMKVSSIADSLARSENRKEFVANSLRLRGTILTYFGQGSEGLALLNQAENSVEDTLGRAILGAAKAHFLASMGENDQARAALEGPLTITRALGHKRIADLAEVTNAIIAANEGANDKAVPLLEKIIGDSKKTGFTQFSVCASDLLAKIYLNAGQSEKAKRVAQLGFEGRARSQAVKTTMEANRQQRVAR